MTRLISLRERRHHVESARDFGRVAVMLGGYSSEREVSLKTGAAVLKALQERGVDAHPWDPAARSLGEFSESGFDRVWIALHGPGGEDGALQGALEWLDTPYTGSGVMASAIAMDKVRSKHLFDASGIPTPEYAVIRHRADAVLAAEEIGYPLILKPAGEGSSVGMSKVFDADDLDDAVKLALGYGGIALAERCIVGIETTVAVLQGVALPSIRIETPRVFYDYRAKYESDRTKYFCPGTDDVALEKRYAELALAAFNELGCSGWGRVDFMTGADNEPKVLEVNTVPGMTSHSLVPMAAKQAGIDFAELCWRILETSVGTDTSATHVEVVANDA
ncbi:MAG: D-alanine--D-alanine ligase [Gammaproteobacteria bacterium]|nr:D-alanine--D-alanine ligase [Gammaproteobacteria bacterium]MDH5303446.1 D-alanine--D-alanine ligase [Gammaproteobacteria bacterium]MDH5321817.1 D-alanine--D-alanine ligase [Gammaproteobacteria bacterium]